MGGKSPIKTLAIITVVLLVVVIVVLAMPRKVELEGEDGTMYTGKTGIFLKSGSQAA